MVLIRNVPLSTDLLSDSQVDLYDNNNAIDDSFADDHFAASDTSSNNGFHAQVTTVTYNTVNSRMQTVTSAPPSNSLNCVFYGYQEQKSGSYTPLPPLQYSMPANPSTPTPIVPTPLTCLQSSVAGLTIAGFTVAPAPTISLFNFASTSPPVPFCYGTVYAGCLSKLGMVQAGFFWPGSGNGTVTATTATLGNIQLSFQFSGSTLQLANSSTSMATGVTWTVEFKRIYTPT